MYKNIRKEGVGVKKTNHKIRTGSVARSAFALFMAFMLVFNAIPLSFMFDGGVGALFALDKPVRIVETSETFDTLCDAVIAANKMGVATIEISANLDEGKYFEIRSDIRIYGVGGSYTLNLLKYPFYVYAGASLTLGNGSKDNLLTINRNATVVTVFKDGTINVHDGVKIKDTSNSYAAIEMGQFSHPNTRGIITGGIIEGNHALEMDNGAYLTEISGGEFIGKEYALFVYGSSIGEISGGRFIKTGPTPNAPTNGVVLENSSVGKISGGYFETADIYAMGIFRGSWIGEISGGEFVTKSNANNTGGGIHIAAPQAKKTGIGKFSGGETRGGYYGIRIEGDGSRIDEISGGDIRGIHALDNSNAGLVGKITGGSFTGTENANNKFDCYGISNDATIGEIGGQALIGTVKNSHGIVNKSKGVINEISGGAIFSGEYGDAISNRGLIKLVSGGVMMGYYSAINNEKFYAADVSKLETITNGVFSGENDHAFYLSSALTLEPDLNFWQGLGRYRSGNGAIFNNVSLVVYPEGYSMSKETEAVEGIIDIEFKYLTNGQKPLPPQYTLTINNSYPAEYAGEGMDSGAGEYYAGDFVAIDAGEREGLIFIGWTVNAGDVTLDDAEAAITGFVMPAWDVTLTADWRVKEEEIPPDPIPDILYTLTINNSYPAEYAGEGMESGAGEYYAGDFVAIDAGEREGLDFIKWTINAGDPALEDPLAVATSFIMPERDVTLTAGWAVKPDELPPSPPPPPPPPKTLMYTVTVKQSYADAEDSADMTSGSGAYYEGDIVAINAGEPDGLTFSRWYVNEGDADLADYALAITTFVMPGQSVIITAIWVEEDPPLSQQGGSEGFDDTAITPPVNTETGPASDPITGPTDPVFVPPVTPQGPQAESQLDHNGKKGGASQSQPPIDPPAPTKTGHTLVQDGPGSFIEFDDSGVPAGRWQWDAELQIWIFESATPLAWLPQTGEKGAPARMVILSVFTLMCAAFLVFSRRYSFR